jgi:hypothetical protein
MLIYGEWVDEEVLAPVPHRQYVFTAPKVLRPCFHQRHRLGELCRIVGHLLNHAYREPHFVVYPHRGSEMSFVGMIEEPVVTEQIPRNRGLLPPVTRCPL